MTENCQGIDEITHGKGIAGKEDDGAKNRTIRDPNREKSSWTTVRVVEDRYFSLRMIKNPLSTYKEKGISGQQGTPESN